MQRIESQDPLVVTDGLRLIADDLFGDEGDLVEESDARDLVGRALGGAIVHVLELAPALRRGEDLLQPVERPIVRGVHREDAFQVRHRAFGVAELLVVQARRALAELELHRHGES